MKLFEGCEKINFNIDFGFYLFISNAFLNLEALSVVIFFHTKAHSGQQ